MLGDNSCHTKFITLRRIKLTRIFIFSALPSKASKICPVNAQKMHKEGKTPLKAEIFIASLFKKDLSNGYLPTTEIKSFKCLQSYWTLKQVFSCDYCDPISIFRRLFHVEFDIFKMSFWTHLGICLPIILLKIENMF